MRVKTFRDVIWGDIELKEEEIDIVDSNPFQRLRRIKQLGLADLVYPCAKHTRFDHSLGTLSAAQLMVNNLKSPENENALDDDTIDCIRCYALLHDISHIPFGHTLEDEGMLYSRHDEGERGKYYIDQLRDIIPSDIYEPVSKLLEEKVDKNNKFISDIVSNTICADLIDYIQRDGYFTGATGLRFKFDDRILKFMTLGYDEDGYRRLIFKPSKDKIRIDVITDIIQLLRYRYMITERVTFHHARCAANAMLIKAIQLLGPPKEDIFYWMGDEDVLNYISGSDDKNIRELGNMLKYRNLFKIVFRVTRYTATELFEGDVKAVSNKYGTPEGRMELEDKLIKEITKISGLNHFDENQIAIYCPSDENMNFKETRVLIQWRGEYPTPLTKFEPVHTWEHLIIDEVKALEKKYKALWNMHIFVHPKYRKHIYEIEKCCERVLGVKNDPLLKISFERREDYKGAIEYERMLSRKETEIVTTARQIELGERSYREVSPSAEGVETSREEALKEAIRHVTSPAEKEDGKLDYNDKDFRGKRGSKKR
jgi:HD superfamily phosphohydrolase